MAEQEIKEAGNEQQDGEDEEVGVVVLEAGDSDKRLCDDVLGDELST